MSAPGTIGVIPATPNFNITNIIGVDVGNSYPNYIITGSTASGFTYNETNVPPFALGTRVQGTNNTGFTFCVVGTVASINQYDCVAIDQNFNAQPVPTTLTLTNSVASTGFYTPGFNQGPGLSKSAPSTVYNFCWIATQGNGLLVNIASASAGIALGGPLFCGSVPGQLCVSSTAGTAQLVAGAVNTSSIATQATSVISANMTISVVPGATFTSATVGTIAP